MNLEASRSAPDQSPVTRLEIVLGSAFFGLMVASAAAILFSTGALLNEQSREAALIAVLALCIAVGGILVRGRFALNGEHS
jgi:hypothetical protein